MEITRQHIREKKHSGTITFHRASRNYAAEYGNNFKPTGLTTRRVKRPYLQPYVGENKGTRKGNNQEKRPACVKNQTNKVPHCVKNLRSISGRFHRGRGYFTSTSGSGGRRKEEEKRKGGRKTLNTKTGGKARKEMAGGVERQTP